MPRRARILLLILAIGCGVALRVVYVARGHFYLDSGFYLHAARAVLEGKLPYRDFFFAQGPVYPYLYGATRAVGVPLTGSSILTARATSALLGLAACAIACATARRLGGADAALAAALLLFPNSFLAYCQCVEKLYAPAGFLAALAAWLAVTAGQAARSGRWLPWRFSAAAAVLAVATALRLTMLPSMAALALLLLLRAPRWHRLAIPLAAFGATLAAVFAPFLVLAPEALWYHTFGIHESAAGDSPYHFGLGNKALVLLVLARDNQILLLLGLIALPVLAWDRLRGSRTRARAFLQDEAELAFLWLFVAAVSAANFAANWVHASYTTVVMPVLGAAIAVTAIRVAPLVPEPRTRRAIGAVILAGSFLQPLAYGRKEIWSRDARVLSPYAPELVASLRSLARPGEPVLVCNPAFGVEADRPLLRGSEGFPFTYTPAWDTARCRERVTLNNELLVDLLRERVPAVVALVKDQFRVGFPGFVPMPAGQEDEVWHQLEEAYELVDRLPNPDATGNDVLVYVRRR